MPADAPTILATSGGLRRGERSAWGLAPLVEFAVELAGVSGRRPRICYVGTAGGDQAWQAALFSEAARAAGLEPAVLSLFPMPNVADPTELLLAQDVVWVGGGSVANLLALWRLHRLDRSLAAAWRSGVVLGGVSAGSICWHAAGPTDSFGPTLRAVEGLSWLPFANGVHYDSEPQRRPFLHSLVATGQVPSAYASDDGVGLLYRGQSFVEAVSEVPNKGAYFVERSGDEAVEERIDPRLLPGAR